MLVVEGELQEMARAADGCLAGFEAGEWVYRERCHVLMRGEGLRGRRCCYETCIGRMTGWRDTKRTGIVMLWRCVLEDIRVVLVCWRSNVDADATSVEAVARDTGMDVTSAFGCPARGCSS
jgi:hypothetical protein